MSLNSPEKEHQHSNNERQEQQKQLQERINILKQLETDVLRSQKEHQEKVENTEHPSSEKILPEVLLGDLENSAFFWAWSAQIQPRSHKNQWTINRAWESIFSNFRIKKESIKLTFKKSESSAFEQTIAGTWSNSKSTESFFCWEDRKYQATRRWISN